MTKSKHHTREQSPFTPQEYALMALFATGRGVTREAMVAALYGHRYDGGPDTLYACLNVVFHRVRGQLAKRGIDIPKRTRFCAYRVSPEAAMAIRDLVGDAASYETKQYLVSTLRETINILDGTHA